MSLRTPWIQDRRFFELNCWLYSRLLLLYPDTLYVRYGEEMQWVFREELKRAARSAPKAYMALWCSAMHDTVLQVGPIVLLRLGIMSAAVFGTLAVMLPMLFAIPTRFPKSHDSCVPRIHVPQSMRSSNDSIAFKGVDREAEIQDAVDVPTRNPR
jgi:hypothetical protein